MSGVSNLDPAPNQPRVFSLINVSKLTQFTNLNRVLLLRASPARSVLQMCCLSNAGSLDSLEFNGFFLVFFFWPLLFAKLN